MVDRVQLDVAPHADVRAVIDGLWKLENGLATLGLQCEALKRAREMLLVQSLEIAHHRKEGQTDAS